MPEETQVKGVTLDAENVVIEWADGLTCRYPFRYLRLQCGCAGCVEEMTGRQLLNPMSVPDEVLVIDHMPIGKYALAFMFTDGHSTGIYPLKNLREMSRFDAVQCEGGE